MGYSDSPTHDMAVLQPFPYCPCLKAIDISDHIAIRFNLYGMRIARVGWFRFQCQRGFRRDIQGFLATISYSRDFKYKINM